MALREPPDLEEAIERAEREALALRRENAAAVALLKVTNALTSAGVFILVAGVVVLLAQDPAPPPTAGP